MLSYNSRHDLRMICYSRQKDSCRCAVLLIALLGAVMACNLPPRPLTLTPLPSETPTPVPTLFIVPSPRPGIPYPDVSGMFADVCFKYLETVADQPFRLA